MPYRTAQKGTEIEKNDSKLHCLARCLKMLRLAARKKKGLSNFFPPSPLCEYKNIKTFPLFFVFCLYTFTLHHTKKKESLSQTLHKRFHQADPVVCSCEVNRSPLGKKFHFFCVCVYLSTVFFFRFFLVDILFFPRSSPLSFFLFGREKKQKKIIAFLQK